MSISCLSQATTNTVLRQKSFSARTKTPLDFDVPRPELIPFQRLLAIKLPAPFEAGVPKREERGTERDG